MLFPGQLQCSDSRSMDVVNQGKCEGRPTFVCPVFSPWIRCTMTFLQAKCPSGHTHIDSSHLKISQKFPAYLSYSEFECVTSNDNSSL